MIFELYLLISFYDTILLKIIYFIKYIISFRRVIIINNIKSNKFYFTSNFTIFNDFRK